MTGTTRIAIGELHTRVCVDGGPSPAIDVELGIGLAQLGRGLTLAQGAPGQRTGVLTLQQVEHVFGELAALSLGRPSSSSGIPTDRPFVSYVLILREFMHHLAFGDISIEQAATQVG